MVFKSLLCLRGISERYSQDVKPRCCQDYPLQCEPKSTSRDQLIGEGTLGKAGRVYKGVSL